MDCNKPPTDLDAMGIYSDVVVCSEDQIGTVRHCWEMLGLLGGAEVTPPGSCGQERGSQRMLGTGC